MGTEESEPGAPSNQVVRRLQTSKVALRGAIAKVAEGRIMVSHYDSTQVLPGCAKRPLEGGPSRGHGASRMPRNGARTVFGGRGGSNATSLLDSKAHQVTQSFSCNVVNVVSEYPFSVYPACYTGTHPVRILPANTPLVVMFDLFVSAEAVCASLGNGVTAQHP